MAARIPSGHEGYLRPWVEKTAALFRDPIATVRDRGEGMAKAVAPLRARGVPDFICHYHFLGAVGKKLFEKPYRVLANLLRQHKVQGDGLHSRLATPKGEFGYLLPAPFLTMGLGCPRF
jgi:hypothetical protein